MRMFAKDTKRENKEKLKLLWQFLRGSKRYFLVAILAAAVTALADMLQPQIIRAAVDCAIGGKEGDFPAFVMDFVNSIGGFSYL
jgi:ATP-binding cassette subfamily B protein